MTFLGRIISLPFVLAASVRPDRYGHMGVGALLGLLALFYGWVYGALAVITWAACKEWWDALHPTGDSDIWDFVATCVGGALSIGLIVLKAHHGS